MRSMERNLRPGCIHRGASAGGGGDGRHRAPLLEGLLMARRVPAILAASALPLGPLATAPAASAATAAKPGNTSLAEVLTSDGNTFDKNRNDFDIVTEAALAVIGAKPDSPVALLADGNTRLTVFAPTDQAF